MPHRDTLTLEDIIKRCDQRLGPLGDEVKEVNNPVNSVETALVSPPASPGSVLDSDSLSPVKTVRHPKSDSRKIRNSEKTKSAWAKNATLLPFFLMSRLSEGKLVSTENLTDARNKNNKQ